MLRALRLTSIATLTLFLASWLTPSSSTLTPVDSPTAAGGSTGTLIVQTIDSSGPVSGASVRVFAAGTSTLVAVGTTNFAGKATFQLPFGDYTIFASKIEFIFGFPIGVFGSGSATVNGPIQGVQIVLNRFIY